MALVNALGALALDVTVATVKAAVDAAKIAITTVLTDGTQKTQVTNLPATQTVAGVVSVSNLPATQLVSGTVAVSNPTTNPETGLAKDATFAKDADGGIKSHVQNFPAIQQVSGTVTVANPTASPETGLAKDATLTSAVGASADSEAHRQRDRHRRVEAPTDAARRRSTSGRLDVNVGNAPTVTVANPTTSPETGLAKDATLTGGTAKSVVRGGAKGASGAADATTTAEGADHQALDVQAYHGGAAVDPRDVTDRAGRALGAVSQTGGPWTVNPAAESAGVGVGAAADAEAAGNGSLIAIAKRLRTMLAGGLPAALTGSGNLKVAIAEGGTATPVTQSGGPWSVSAASLPLPVGAAQDATLTGGTAKTINRGGAKGATAAADVTTTAQGVDHQALDAQLYHGGAAVDPRDVTDRAARLLGTVAQTDGPKASYTVFVNGVVNNLGSDVFTLQGSGTKTVKIIRVAVILVQGGTVTAAQNAVTLVKRTAANTGGVTAAVSLTTSKRDTNDAAMTAVPVYYTTAPTAVGAGTVIRRIPFLATASGTAAAVPVFERTFGDKPGEKQPTLRGTSEFFAVNLAAVLAGTAPTLTWYLEIDVTEE